MNRLKLFFSVILISLLIMGTSYGDNPPNEKARWENFSDINKIVYTSGVTAGIASATMTYSRCIGRDTTWMNCLSAYGKVIFKFDSDAGIEVINSLYADPANSYIDIPIMLFIAQLKLMGASGEDIEKLLEIERKDAMEMHNILEKLDSDEETEQ